LDKHACHYVKIELDKIFGPDNFQNEIIWSYRTGGASKRRFGQKHDNLYWYSKDPKKYFYNCIKERIYYEKPFFNPRVDEQGRYYADILPDDTWEVKAVLNISKERIGYPTQKPEELLSKIINALSKQGDLVADFFSGGGTTVTVAEKLNRRWIGCDVSRIAISVARDRIQASYTKEAGIKPIKNKPVVGFFIQKHVDHED
jgi:DNA modification methylase